jgi:hypothetical protein
MTFLKVKCFSWKEKYLIWVRYQVSLWRKQTADRISREAQPTANSPTVTKLQSLVASEEPSFEYHIAPVTDYASMKVEKNGNEV